MLKGYLQYAYLCIYIYVCVCVFMYIFYLKSTRGGREEGTTLCTFFKKTKRASVPHSHVDFELFFLYFSLYLIDILPQFSFTDFIIKLRKRNAFFLPLKYFFFLFPGAYPMRVVVSTCPIIHFPSPKQS